MIRVAIVEDDPVVREELGARLAQAGNLELRGVFASAEEAAAGLVPAAPDVAVVDIQLPGRSGIEPIALAKPALPATQFLILTTFVDDDLVFAALATGASGYLLKRSLPGEVADAVRDLHAGGSPMSSGIARKLVRAFQPPARPEPLSAREAELLDRLARGRSYKECAAEMAVSLDTVRTYVRRLYEKLHVHSRHEAVRLTRTRR
jgi:DNA-binding NarL/FixJ family response regulator